MKLQNFAASLLLASVAFSSSVAMADDYAIDTKGAHAFVQFRVKHLGYSWLYGRFNEFGGQFSYDEKAPDKAKVEVTINTASVDSNHAERDKHLRSADFLEVEKFPEAKFVSTSFTPGDGDTATLKGDLTLHGVTKPVEIAVEKIGGGKDPWGGYRMGFQGSTSFGMSDFDLSKDFGTVEMILSVEGIKQ